MIETTIREVEGVKFLETVKIVSWETRKGIPVQEVDAEVIGETWWEGIRKMLMLEEVEYDFSRKTYIYAQRPVNDITYKVVEFIGRFYWKLMRFLYDECRVFKGIPAGEMFSWRYFTPYVWYRRIVSGVDR